MTQYTLRIQQRTTLKIATVHWLFVSIALIATSACGSEKHPTTRSALPQTLPPGVQRIGYIQNPRITESSGVVASRQYPGVFWTHNDGPKSYTLYGITREGKSVANVQLTGAITIHDWEDIAIDDEHHIYIGDIGNNDARRFSIAVYEIDEPDPKNIGATARVKRGWQLRFPKAPFDCESLFVWKGYGYVISKVFNDAKAEIYRFPLTNQAQPFTLEFVTRLKIESPVTGADISADGAQLGLVAHSGPYVYRIDGDVTKAGFRKPAHIKFKHEHIEGCCFVADGLLATAETREIFLFSDPAFRPITPAPTSSGP